jgi:hypothetical protein
MLTMIAEYIGRDTWAKRQEGVVKSAYQQAAFDELGYTD